MKKTLLFLFFSFLSQWLGAQVFLDLKKGHEPYVKRYMKGSEIQIKLKKDDYYIEGKINVIDSNLLDVNGFKLKYSDIDYIVVTNKTVQFWQTAFLYAGLGAIIIPPVNNLLLNFRPLFPAEFTITGIALTSTSFILWPFKTKKYYFEEGYRLVVYIPQK